MPKRYGLSAAAGSYQAEIQAGLTSDLFNWTLDVRRCALDVCFKILPLSSDLWSPVCRCNDLTIPFGFAQGLSLSNGKAATRRQALRELTS